MRPTETFMIRSDSIQIPLFYTHRKCSVWQSSSQWIHHEIFLATIWIGFWNWNSFHFRKLSFIDLVSKQRRGKRKRELSVFAIVFSRTVLETVRKHKRLRFRNDDSFVHGKGIRTCLVETGISLVKAKGINLRKSRRATDHFCFRLSLFVVVVSFFLFYFVFFVCFV